MLRGGSPQAAASTFPDRIVGQVTAEEMKDFGAIEPYRRLAVAALFLLYLVVIVGSLVPAPMLPPVPTSDKVEHSTSYLLLSYLPFLSFRIRRQVALAIGWAIVLGGVLELLQGLTATRTPDWLDFRANLIGVAIGTALGLLTWNLGRLTGRFRKRQPAGLRN